MLGETPLNSGDIPLKLGDIPLRLGEHHLRIGDIPQNTGKPEVRILNIATINRHKYVVQSGHYFCNFSDSL